MVTKIDGPFHWHKHDDTDDFFLVLTSTLGIAGIAGLLPGPARCAQGRRAPALCARSAHPADRADGHAKYGW